MSPPARFPLPAAEETAIPPDIAVYAEIEPAGENLEVCQWDYCIVHDHIGRSGSRTSSTRSHPPAEAQAIADEVVADWDVSPGLGVLDPLEGDLGGLYDPNNDSITLDEPLIAWSLIHELAHHVVVETDSPEVEGHGAEEFLDHSGHPGRWLVTSNVPIPGGGSAGPAPVELRPAPGSPHRVAGSTPRSPCSPSRPSSSPSSPSASHGTWRRG